MESLPLHRLSIDGIPGVFKFSQQVLQVLPVLASLSSLMEAAAALQGCLIHGPLGPQKFLELLIEKQ